MIVSSFILLRRLFSRKQAAESYHKAVIAGVGGAIAISTLAVLGHISDIPLLMAPFGATCVLLFSLPQSPLAQPVNVIAGHLISVMIGLTLHSFLPLDTWSIGIAVGLAITAMAALRVTHPPAGADPIVVFFSHPGWEYIIFPVVLGSITLVAIAWVYHKITPHSVYPLTDDSN